MSHRRTASLCMSIARRNGAEGPTSNHSSLFDAKEVGQTTFERTQEMRVALLYVRIAAVVCIVGGALKTVYGIDCEGYFKSLND